MSNSNLAEVEYVSQKMFDLRLDDIKYRTSTERERMDDKLDRFQAIMEKNFAEMHSMINEFRVELKGIEGDIKELKGDIKALDEKIDAVNMRVDSVEKRIDDLHQSHNKWFTLFGILFTIITVATSILAFFK
ncbi:MAG: hypothetical protein IJ859_01495 [Synergistaceae bacterium]|nr:hypothetical protein [Synergistaceae bacterium]